MKQFQIKLFLATQQEHNYVAIVKALNDNLEIFQRKGLAFVCVEGDDAMMEGWEFGGEKGEEFNG